MRFNVKVILLWLILLCAVLIFITLPKSPYLQSKTDLQDVIEGNDIPETHGARDTPSRVVWGTPDPLIAEYGHGDMSRAGENGRGIVFVGDEEKEGEKYMKEYHVNMLASDVIALNRRVPDSRHPGCRALTYNITGMPNVTVIVPFHDEWLSLLLRTVYSIINRTPPSLLREVLLIDDASTMDNLHGPLDKYVADHFPNDLVRVLRMPERSGLIQARLKGWREAKGEVLVFLDSHMEMNIDWLPPLLVEIQKNKRTIAMSVLDYIEASTLKYNVRPDYLIRYGFNWKLIFFECYFRDDQIGPQYFSPRKGVTMVGAAFAVDKQYFTDIGAYDEGMKIWGGENLELSWRVWLCGGQMVHVPCSHMGHIARGQPYTFPGGRHAIEMHNYKRAVDVWMGPMKKYVYHNFPEMTTLDVGNISSRVKLKERLQCKDFSWFIRDIWPELLAYDVDVTAWGSARNLFADYCLDNYDNYYPGELYLIQCHNGQNTQGFSLTKEGYLRTTLQSVVFTGSQAGERPALQSYRVGPPSTWTHTPNSVLVHDGSQLCLDVRDWVPIMSVCDKTTRSQMWTFSYYKDQST